jgi:DNA-binding PadR family transcriptional regulator
MYRETVTEQALLILASLATGESHGYGIASDVEALSGGRVKLAAGTLYGVLSRLAADGLIIQTREEVVGGRRRRYYELTGAGHAVLNEEAARLSSTAAAVSARLAAAARRGPRPA